MPKHFPTAVALFALFVLPLAIYFGFKWVSTPQFHPFPYQYSVEGGDTTWYQIPTFYYVTRDGDTLSGEGLEGKISVLSVFSWEQRVISKVLHANLRRVYDNAEKAPFIHLLSIHMGSHDSLASYVDSMEVDPARWQFAHMGTDEIYALSKAIGLKETLAKKAQGDAFTTQTVALVDKKGKVRGYYVATDLAEIKRLNEDLRALIVMEYREELKK